MHVMSVRASVRGDWRVCGLRRVCVACASRPRPRVYVSCAPSKVDEVDDSKQRQEEHRSEERRLPVAAGDGIPLFKLVTCKNTAFIHVDGDVGKGRVALEHTVVVGRVYMRRMDGKSGREKTRRRPVPNPNT